MDAHMITLTLPFPPTVNNYKRIGRLTRTKSGKIFQPRINSDATRRFYYEVWIKVKGLQIESLGDSPISLEIDVYPPDKRKRDIDNIIKPTVDSLMNSGLFDDDYQISKLLVIRREVFSGGKIVVKIVTYRDSFS